MMEAFTTLFIQSLPQQLSNCLRIAQDLDNHVILNSTTNQILGKEPNKILDDINVEDFESWPDYIRHRIQILMRNASEASKYELLASGISSLNCFVQSNISGPPLDFNSAELLLPASFLSNPSTLQIARKNMITSLSVDGEAVYSLIPNVELFCLAKEVTSSQQSILESIKSAVWLKLRVDFMHQRLLSEIAPSLQSAIFKHIDILDILLQTCPQDIKSQIYIEFLLEKVSILLYHGKEKSARLVIDQATKLRAFNFAITGIMGKRTKFQENATSQLVVLAKSKEYESDKISQNIPATVNLNDDLLLDSISFTSDQSPDLNISKSLPQSLQSLDPQNQPLLHPLDSIILLSTATSITNTSPVDGLTREETLPYAIRVLDGGSSNWQIYTQALLVRSRIEGYKPRTVERGLLQLQALVDQVIADTSEVGESTGNINDAATRSTAPTTFLPRPTKAESAPAKDRLRYVYCLAAHPTRWALEAELAARWINLGGLRSALEIYSRLEMWAEVALCWAGTDREDKARRIVRRQLYLPASDDSNSEIDEDREEYLGSERGILPTDAPRLFCILGDIEKNIVMYQRAWEISDHKYYKAQKALGKYYFGMKQFVKASQAYHQAVKIRQLDRESWFILGCSLLELQQFGKAAEVFSRCVQLDDDDPESWSNLAVALLHVDEEETEDQKKNDMKGKNDDPEDDLKNDNESRPSSIIKTQNRRRDAHRALSRSAHLARDNYRVWDNLLTVSASFNPPIWTDVLSALTRVVEIRGPIDGEACIDVKIFGMLVSYITASERKEFACKPSDEHSTTRAIDYINSVNNTNGADFTDNNINTDNKEDNTIDTDNKNSSSKLCSTSEPNSGVIKGTLRLLDKSIVPLITSIPTLWYLVAQVREWQGHWSSALESEEKAWRIINGPGGQDITSTTSTTSTTTTNNNNNASATTTEAQHWHALALATVRLVHKYQSLGPRPQTERLGAGSGEMVRRDWAFKARSAVRSVLGKGKGEWEGTEGWDMLAACGEEVRAVRS